MFKAKTRKLKMNRAGFSLIEILIVTVITTTVFTVIYSFYSASIKQNVESRNEIIASNLAQEGIEIIRNIRDENVMKGLGIRTNLGDSCFPSVDSDGNTSCSGALEIKIDINGWYTSSGGVEATPFTRECQILGDDISFTATCEVKWDSFTDAGLERKVTSTAVLTNWQN